jgi:hypothetical protein
MIGSKIQKLTISKAIVEAVYSMDPPGRFLKQCPDTGKWSELSERDAADRVAQAMAYAIRGKDELKRKRDERRRSLRSKKKPKDEDDVRSPAQNSESNRSSSVAHHGGATRQGGTGAGGMSNDAQSDGSNLLFRLPGNSHLQQQQQQLPLRQLHQAITAALPESVNIPIDSQSLNQHGLTQLLQMQQQQLPLQIQYNIVQNQLALELLRSQIALQPTSNEGLTRQLLTRAYQQQQQQQLLLQNILHRQNALLSVSLPTSISLSAPLLTDPQSQSVNDNLLLTLLQQSNPASNRLLLSSMLFGSNLPHQPSSNAGGITSSTPLSPQQIQQMDQLQRSLMLQQQNLASSLGASSSNIQLPFHHPLLQQTLQARLNLQLQQNSRGIPPPQITSVEVASANVSTQQTRQAQEEGDEADEE